MPYNVNKRSTADFVGWRTNGLDVILLSVAAVARALRALEKLERRLYRSNSRIWSESEGQSIVPASQGDPR
jgi:hypothetical protein